LSVVLNPDGLARIEHMFDPQQSPYDPAAALSLLEAAASAGDAAAHRRLAALAAAGVGRAQNWSYALDHLKQAATLGDANAAAQLTLLRAGPQGQERDATVSHWLQSPDKTSLCETPRIRSLPAFISPTVCAWLIQRAVTQLAPAQIYDSNSGQATADHSRSNWEADFGPLALDVVQALVRARIAAALQVPVAVFEPSKVLHYQAGQCFETHFDFLDPALPGFAAELAQRGQRIATLLIALNDDYQGGETHFPLIDLAWRGKTGDALLFANVTPEQRPDRLTLHAGLPPNQGEKWLFSQWIRNQTPR
jgi:hypothetical protein